MDDDLPGAVARAAAAALPGVKLTAAAFTRWLEAHGISRHDLAGRGQDLYLAAACAAGDAAALQHFDRAFLGEVSRHLARFRFDAARVAEVQQLLRIRLLCEPQLRIDTFAGKAPLDAWVRVAAVRTALNLIEAERQQVAALDRHALEDAVAALASPHGLGAGEVRVHFQTALEEALSGLAIDDKTLLRLHFVDQLNIDAMGRVLKIHRATVARRLVAVRARVLDGVRARLALALDPSTAEFRSLVRLVQDELQVSMERLLAVG